MKQIVRFLKNFRAKKAWTQADMAEKLGLSYGYYKQIECGKANIGVSARHAIAKTTRTSAKKILDLSMNDENMEEK